MMCERPEAAAPQRCLGPAGPAPMLLGHATAGAEDWLLSHIITETTLGNDSFTLSAHSPPWLFPDTRGRAQCPDLTQNESLSLVSRVKLCSERAKAKLFRGHWRKTDH